MLRLDAVNNCVIIPETPDYKGMLNVAKDTCTWGEIGKETLIKMLKKRLRLKGNKRIDEKTLKEITKFDSFEGLADALIEGKVKLKDFKQLQPIFRLTPPSKGFKSVKEHYPKGDLGYRGKEINELLERMI
jgi:large subunit ribosomal protein L30